MPQIRCNPFSQQGLLIFESINNWLKKIMQLPSRSTEVFRNRAFIVQQPTELDNAESLAHHLNHYVKVEILSAEIADEEPTCLIEFSVYYFSFGGELLKSGIDDCHCRGCSLVSCRPFSGLSIYPSGNPLLGRADARINLLDCRHACSPLKVRTG